MVKKIIVITTVLLIIAAGVYFIASAKNGQKNGLTFVKVTRGDILEKALAIGQIEPKKEVIVKSPIRGTILSRKVNEGDPIVPLTSYQAGTDLFTMADMTSTARS